MREHTHTGGGGEETQQADVTCTQGALPDGITQPGVYQNFKAPPPGGDAQATPAIPTQQVGHHTLAQGAYSSMAVAIKNGGSGTRTHNCGSYNVSKLLRRTR
jgi:hypothetical protein